MTAASEEMQKKIGRTELLTRRHGTFARFRCKVGGGDVVCGIVGGATRKEVDVGVT